MILIKLSYSFFKNLFFPKRTIVSLKFLYYFYTLIDGHIFLRISTLTYYLFYLEQLPFL